jgi:hypothetical protein
MVITICGSTRFKKEIMDVARDLTLAGHIVLAPCVFHHMEDEPLSTEDKIRLDNLHRQKINMSDAIFVVNVNGYIGESTYGEIDWADRMKKQVFFLNDPPKPEGQAAPGEDVQPVVNSEEEAGEA